MQLRRNVVISSESDLQVLRLPGNSMICHWVLIVLVHSVLNKLPVMFC